MIYLIRNSSHLLVLWVCPMDGNEKEISSLPRKTEARRYHGVSIANKSPPSSPY